VRRSSVIGWVALAILGLAVAAAVSIAASQLSSQRIGLASEPLTAGNRLAPRTGTIRIQPATTPTQTHTQTTPSSTQTTTTDDNGGQGRGRGRSDGDHDSDDD
jgi:hypothetical protein